MALVIPIYLIGSILVNDTLAFLLKISQFDINPTCYMLVHFIKGSDVLAVNIQLLYRSQLLLSEQKIHPGLYENEEVHGLQNTF